MRVTNRQGKGTAKHNFREFDLSKADHIDKELLGSNKYMLGNKSITLNQLVGFHFKIRKELSQVKDGLRSLENQHKFDNLTRTEQIELCVYNRLFGGMVAEQNERHISTGHYSKQRDILDYYLNRKTEPTETILQVGNHEDCNLPSDELWKIYINDYLPEFKKRYGSRVKILNSCLHCDEPGATPHIHERLIFIGHNSHGEPCSNKNQALKELGFELPDPSKPESRYNTRLMEYSKQCRQLWIECCQRHGLEIDVIPSNPGKHGLELAKYKANKEEERLYQTQEELSNLQNEKALLESNIQGLQEYVNRNSESIRSWKNEVERKINTINNVMEEYKGFANDAEQRYSQEVREYILNALGDVPEEPEDNFNQPKTGFNSYNYDEEDYEL